ncbi:hypothetical protein BDZ91DRAFT_793164 [Kalaharituber pfeilii]|nr:hypothetical protein BDZ91DRAFT_793164 [Kalaharituber pfeilii]
MAATQEAVGNPLPKKRKPLFQEEMLMDFPDPSTLPSNFKSALEKNNLWLKSLDIKHREQRLRLRNRHLSEYQQWCADLALSIDPDEVRDQTHFPMVNSREAFCASSLRTMQGEVAQRMAREGKGWRQVIVGLEQVESAVAASSSSGGGEDTSMGGMEDGEVLSDSTREKERAKQAKCSNMEFAAEIAKCGVMMRKGMVEETLEMRFMQAKEKEIVQQFLMKLDEAKFGPARGSLPSGPVLGPPGPPQKMFAATVKHSGNLPHGGLNRVQSDERLRAKAPPNIKIPPPGSVGASGMPTATGTSAGSRTETPVTSTSTATMGGDGYFSGLGQQPMSTTVTMPRDPRLPPFPTTPLRPEQARDPRLLSRHTGGDGSSAGDSAAPQVPRLQHREQRINSVSSTDNTRDPPIRSNISAPPTPGLPSNPMKQSTDSNYTNNNTNNTNIASTNTTGEPPLPSSSLSFSSSISNKTQAQLQAQVVNHSHPLPPLPPAPSSCTNENNNNAILQHPLPPYPPLAVALALPASDNANAASVDTSKITSDTMALTIPASHMPPPPPINHANTGDSAIDATSARPMEVDGAAATGNQMQDLVPAPSTVQQSTEASVNRDNSAMTSVETGTAGAEAEPGTVQQQRESADVVDRMEMDG